MLKLEVEIDQIPDLMKMQLEYLKKSFATSQVKITRPAYVNAAIAEGLNALTYLAGLQPYLTAPMISYYVNCNNSIVANLLHLLNMEA